MRAGSLLILAVACWLAGPANAADNPFSRLATAYLVQIGDRDLWSGQVDRRLPMASLTKVMTALLVLEDYRPAEIVTVSKVAAQASGSRIRLKAGDRLSIQALLTATLIASANDACTALAEASAGSVAAFVDRMNDRARTLELSNTHFANPCGLDATGHYSSARDLARLAHTALMHSEFAALVATHDTRISTADGTRSFAFRNSNALIGTYPPAIGVKTGYTARAGKCLIALAQKNGVQVMVVILNAKSRWWDAIGIVENAFDEARASGR